MDDIVLSNLDKLLLQLVFQLEQTSCSKEHERQQIQIYSANVLERKGEICQLQEDINKSEQAILSLCRQNISNKENCNIWKPTHTILKKHEEYLQKNLQNCQETTEKDKKMYQDYMNQYQEVFKQHQAKYLETAIAQQYYHEKKEYEEIQDRVRQYSKLLQQKEAEVMDLQEPGLFQSLSSWASHLASLRQNTKETVTHAEFLNQQSLELVKTAEELEKKSNYFKEQQGKITEDLYHSEVIEEDLNMIQRRAKNQERGTDFDESFFRGSQHLLKDKEQTYKPLHLPSILQKLVQSVPTMKPLFQITKTGGEEKEDLAGHTAETSIYFSHIEKENQKCNDISETNVIETAPVSSITNVQKEILLRLANQNNIPTKQCFESESRKVQLSMAVKEADYKQNKNKPVDSSVISQDGQAESHIRSSVHNSTAGGKDAKVTLEPIIPEPNVVPKTPDSRELKTSLELFLSENEQSMAKSPAFSFLTGFTSKSPGFNFFDFSAFGTDNSSDQLSESCSAGNINPTSPHIGDLFGKTDNEDSFVFAFPSSAPAFQGKDDFNFPFAFGSSDSSSPKGFQSASEKRKPFSLF